MEAIRKTGKSLCKALNLNQTTPTFPLLLTSTEIIRSEKNPKETGPFLQQIQSERPNGTGGLDPYCQLSSSQAGPAAMRDVTQWSKGVMTMHLLARSGLVPSTHGSHTSRNHSDLSECTPPCRPYH